MIPSIRLVSVLVSYSAGPTPTSMAGRVVVPWIPLTRCHDSRRKRPVSSQ